MTDAQILPFVAPNAPLYGPFPKYTVWAKAREQAGHRPVGSEDARWNLAYAYLTRADFDAAMAHNEAWHEYRKRRAAKDRAERRETLPHRNWDARVRYCYVGVAEPARKSTLKHGRWEREPVRCGRPVAAYDVTDHRAMGGLYGACAQHLERALADDPERKWMWADGRPLDRERDDIEAECTVRALAGVR